MPQDGWQDATLEQIRSLLEPDGDVLALVLFGSLAGPLADHWSDIDVLVAVRDGTSGRFFPGTNWIEAIGPLYTYEQSFRERSGVTRSVLEDGRRIDVVVAEESAVTDPSGWPEHPFRGPRRTLFSRSSAIDAIVRDVTEPIAPRPISAEQFAIMDRDFWFGAQLAVHKVIRGDLLIALHLSLELLQQCAVLGMLIRDRAAGTRYHRSGGMGNDEVARFDATRRPYTAAGILDGIEESARAFDRLAAAWSATYRPRAATLAEWVAEARRELSTLRRA